MKPHMLWGFIWIQIICKCHQRSSKFTASGLRVNQLKQYGRCNVVQFLQYLSSDNNLFPNIYTLNALHSIYRTSTSFGRNFKAGHHVTVLYIRHVKEQEISFTKSRASPQFPCIRFPLSLTSNLPEAGRMDVQNNCRTQLLIFSHLVVFQKDDCLKQFKSICLMYVSIISPLYSVKCIIMHYLNVLHMYLDGIKTFMYIQF